MIETIEPELAPDTDAELADLIRGMLTKDPNERLTLNEIGAHPWLQTQGWALQETVDPVQASQQEVDDALTPLLSVHAVSRMKVMAKKWRTKSHKVHRARNVSAPPAVIPNSMPPSA